MKNYEQFFAMFWQNDEELKIFVTLLTGWCGGALKEQEETTNARAILFNLDHFNKESRNLMNVLFRQNFHGDDT
jgi:hypothetical protein